MSISRSFKQKIERDIKRILNKEKKLNYDIEFEHAEVINARNRINWDIYITAQGYKKNYIFIVELERKRQAPIHNLVKSLIWINENSSAPKMFFMHIFDSSYATGDIPDQKIASFVGTQYQKYESDRFCYSDINVEGIGDYGNLNLPQASINKKNLKFNAICKRISKYISDVIIKSLKHK